MSIHVALHHTSRYLYNRPVSHSPHVIRLRPAPHCRTPILSYSLKVQPNGHFLNWQQDPFGNYHARLVFLEKQKELRIETDIVMEMAVYNPFDFFLEESAEKFPFVYAPALKRNLKPFLEIAPGGPLLTELVASIDQSQRKTIDFLVDLNRRIHREISYTIRMEPGVQTPEETLRLGLGSCRDTGWLLVQTLRRLGLAARFVSGYLIQLRADQKALDGPSGTDYDFTDLHAWCEVYLPGAGWVGFDPTSGLLAGEGHIPLACTPEPESAAPVTGAVEKCGSTFENCMQVSRIYESPRVTKPYTEEQWAGIESLGHKIDCDLRVNDVRLTMGGEPTFISIDDMDGEEWNFNAVGPEKRRLAGVLVRRLKNRFAPSGLLHEGQGKWYPGEPLPRWALGCYWRNDGEPIWHDPKLIAEDSVDYGYTARDAQRFIDRLAGILAVKPEHAVPAYEDTWYYLWRERNLPTNVDPLQSHLANKQERDRLARLFMDGLGQIAGYALPLQHRADEQGGCWESGEWVIRREHLYLLPGDSPMGLRLPLESLPWVSESSYPYVHHPDPMSVFPPLPKRQDRGPGAKSNALGAGAPDHVPLPQESADWVIRTALCVEPRKGKLFVFLPPVETTEDYLDLIAAVEQTAAGLQIPVAIEGATPAQDARLNSIKVTPDPGVIEVNIHPSASWDEMVATTTALYEEARHARLGSEKFMMDGRHVGTGGGNHIVVGGPTPAESPLLRRPDLLRSLICYWQNHPSLSFLFSSLFIGPTSQHPRIDESRNDSLYEIEVAFRQIPEHGDIQPWLVDRLFRNLLIDASGNTHRVEFCIDKLYSPDTSTGRLGLLELRAFEMPPHERMSLTQALLLRALVARFWKEPYTQSLVYWGTRLHDRFMLPHFVEQDFRDVIDDLCDTGYPFEHEWFAPHLEFRFPRCGEITRRGINLEIRQALEPWHVLGEEVTSGGTARYVDSSLERLQVKLRGMTGSRHVICCNGRPLPLHPTGTNGEFVAGVRFRAWQPPECLHPTIGIHSPLVFDIVDGWNHRSIGGCTYHVVHPGGLAYDTLPVNASEAEGRRLGRFFPFGHSPGPMEVSPEVRNPTAPLTLDLRNLP